LLVLLILASPRGLQLGLVLQFAFYSYLQLYELLLQHPVSLAACFLLRCGRLGRYQKVLGALKAASADFFLVGSTPSRQDRATCFDSLPAARGRPKVGASGQCSRPGSDAKGKATTH
jgi:hypothetical protein